MPSRGKDVLRARTHGFGQARQVAKTHRTSTHKLGFTLCTLYSVQLTTQSLASGLCTSLHLLEICKPDTSIR